MLALMIGLALRQARPGAVTAPAAPSLLVETGSRLLTETGGLLLLE